MDDHVHVLTDTSRRIIPSRMIIHSWKSYSANRLQRNFGRAGRIWQHRYFDRIIRDERELSEKADLHSEQPSEKMAGN